VPRRSVTALSGARSRNVHLRDVVAGRALRTWNIGHQGDGWLEKSRTARAAELLSPPKEVTNVKALSLLIDLVRWGEPWDIEVDESPRPGWRTSSQA
jgi:hypothetical protein